MKLFLRRRSTLAPPCVGVASFTARDGRQVVIFRDPEDGADSIVFDVFMIGSTLAWVYLFGFSVEPEANLGPAVVGLSFAHNPLGDESCGMVHWFIEAIGAEWDLSSHYSTREASKIWEAAPVPGELCLSLEELDLYRMLGETHPLFWSAERFSEWVKEKAWDS